MSLYKAIMIWLFVFIGTAALSAAAKFTGQLSFDWGAGFIVGYTTFWLVRIYGGQKT